MPESVKVAIVGAGIIGCSLAYYLARRGFTDVMVFDRATAPCTGATPYSAGGIRCQFSTRPNILLTKLSIEEYEKYAVEVHPSFVFNQVGYCLLYVTPEEWAAAQLNVELQRSLGLDVKLWTPQDVADYIPGTEVGDLAGATFHQRDGLSDPYEITMGYYTRAKELGIPFHLEEEILEIVVDEALGKVTGVKTNKREVACDMVVDCCGPWAQQLAQRGGLDVPVAPYKRQLLMTHPFEAVGPTFPMLVDLHSGGYMRPETGGLMLGWADPAIPAGFDTTYDSDWEMQVIPMCAERFPPLMEASILRGWAHMYDITPDHHPIIGRYPAVPNFLMAFGYSGHGVMSAPATGIALAELITEGESKTLDIHPFRITRFAEGEALVERNVI